MDELVKVCDGKLCKCGSDKVVCETTAYSGSAIPRCEDCQSVVVINTTDGQWEKDEGINETVFRRVGTKKIDQTRAEECECD